MSFHMFQVGLCTGILCTRTLNINVTCKCAHMSHLPYQRIRLSSNLFCRGRILNFRQVPNAIVCARDCERVRACTCACVCQSGGDRVRIPRAYCWTTQFGGALQAFFSCSTSFLKNASPYSPNGRYANACDFTRNKLDSEISISSISNVVRESFLYMLYTCANWQHPRSSEYM